MNPSLKRCFGKRSLLYKNFNDPVSYLPLLVRLMTACYFHKDPDLLDFIAGPYDENVSVELRQELWQAVSRYFSSAEAVQDFSLTDDPFGIIYQDLISKKERLDQGEFYTPFPLAHRLAKDLISRYFESQISSKEERAFSEESKGAGVLSLGLPLILDPTCGSGVFLTAALRQLRSKEKNLSPEKLLALLTGFDLNPLAVVMTRGTLFLELFKRESEANEFYGQKSDDYFSAEETGEDPLDRFIARGKKKDPFSIFLFDSLLCQSSQTGAFQYLRKDDDSRFDLILGNPPWICWDQLSEEMRSSTLALWRQYGLFDLSGKEALYGGGKKDLAGLMFYIAADRFLKEEGFLSMIIPISLLRSERAGQGFRRFQIGYKGAFLGLLEINDFSQCSFFNGVQSFFSALVIQKNRRTRYPVSCIHWEGNDLERPERSLLSPIDPENFLSPFCFQNFADERCSDQKQNENEETINSGKRDVVLSAKKVSLVEKRLPNGKLSSTVAPRSIQLLLWNEETNSDKREMVCQTEKFFGSQSEGVDFSESDRKVKKKQENKQYYKAQLGANTAGANGIFWFAPELNFSEENSDLVKVCNLANCGKKKTVEFEPLLERSLLFPLIRWRDVHQFEAVSSAQILLVQDPVTKKGISPEIMKQEYRNILNYLYQFEEQLKNRAAYQKFQSRAPFWSMYNINEGTLSPIKVVWRRMDWQMNAAVLLPDRLGRPLIPQETLSMIPVSSIDEADYLAAILNSSETNRKVASLCQPGTKSFGTPGIMKFLDIQKYNPLNNKHLEISVHGRESRIMKR